MNRSRDLKLLSGSSTLLNQSGDTVPDRIRKYEWCLSFCRLQSLHWFYSDYNCQPSFEYYVKTKISEDIMKQFNVDDSYIRSAKRLKRSYSEEDISHSEKDIPLIDSILRQHEKEKLINKPLLIDVPIFPLATERPRLYKQLYDSQHREPVKFREATKWLNDLVKGDAGIADCLSSEAVECLLKILAEIDNSKDGKDLVAIQSLAVRILSRALSHNMFHKYSRDAVPALVKLMTNPLTDLSVAGVMALTHLAYACPRCMQVILKNGALEQAQEIANKIRNFRLPELRQWVAKVLAVVCYRDLPDHKVKVALMISEDLVSLSVFVNSSFSYLA